MAKLKNPLFAMLSLGISVLTCTGTQAGDIVTDVAYFSAGVYTDSEEQSEETHEPDADNYGDSADDTSEESSEPSSESDGITTVGTVITLNRTEMTDDTDYSVYTEHSGTIYRYTAGRQNGTDYIALSSGAQVRNNTDVSNDILVTAADELPDFSENDGDDPTAPRVLIYHTHSNESFLPEADWFDEDYPIRSVDCAKNMIAVGDALCEALAENGISVVHDCGMYDYPLYTGAYYRSAESLSSILEQYPTIDIAIDLHRDGIVNSDGSLGAPVCVIDGENAAQFMIISCCANEYIDMPDYIENFKLACLLQNTAENLYPSLARPILFDYRNYNQSLSTGALLVEVGSHGNSLDEAVYTGELLGNIIAQALDCG